MGSQISKIEETVYDVYKKSWPTARYLHPSFLISAGALGYVGYAFVQNKSVPTVSKQPFLHLVGVAGGFGMSFWMFFVHSRSMQRLVSRHEYATVQSQLSTVYCSASTVFASLSLGSFLLIHPFSKWSKGGENLGRALIIALVAAEINSLVLDPLVTNLMFDRNNIEFLQSAKNEDDFERLLRNDPKYRIIANKYNLYHSISMLFDLVYHGIQWYHLHILVDRCFVL